MVYESAKGIGIGIGSGAEDGILGGGGVVVGAIINCRMRVYSRGLMLLLRENLGRVVTWPVATKVGLEKGIEG